MAITVPATDAPVRCTPVRYRDEPVAHHGGGYVAPGRRTVTGVWLYPSPEQCRDDSPLGVWIGPEHQVLICPSCGLDCT